MAVIGLLCQRILEMGPLLIYLMSQTLKALSSPQYHSRPGTNGGFLIQHCVGHKPAGTEVDVSLTYADYYYVEAMKRYKGFK